MSTSAPTIGTVQTLALMPAGFGAGHWAAAFDEPLLIMSADVQTYTSSLPLPAGMDQALKDRVCQDDRHLRRQRQQLCRILGEQMKEAFYAPTLTVIADQKWDEAMPDMMAAANKDAKKW